jgi:aminoglycoside phosphotransferase (APT) family kinase protein
VTVAEAVPAALVNAADRSPLFSFVDAAHPFAGAIERFREELATRPRAAHWLADPDTIVHTELKGAARAGGGFVVERVYCSLQRAGDRGFEALSLCFSAKRGRTDWYTFPDEPSLAGLRPFVEGNALAGAPGDASRLDVLRYVPLRRFTFRGRLRSRPGRPVIGKFKKASRVHEAHDRAVAIARAVEAAGRPFTVPTPLGVDDEHRICFQGVVPGEPLSDLLGDEAARADALAGAAALQHAFHALPARGLPAWDPGGFVRKIAGDLAWIAFLRPEAEPVVERARRALELAPAPGDLVCCHGDWVCSHLYRAPGGFAVIDLDLAQRADPLWEVAMALAALARDVPALEAARSNPAPDAAAVLRRAEDAYLDGYRAATGAPVPARRLGFWRLCSEIYELALMLTKDRYEPVAFGRSLARVDELADGVLAA